MVFNGINTVRLAGWVSKLIKNIRKKKKYKGNIKVKVDDTGIGAGVTDNLQEIESELDITVIPVNNGAKPQNEEEYYNLGAETWGEMKNMLEVIKLPDDDDLIGQMSTRKYVLDKVGRIQLEAKEKMKKRGLKSPDRADATALAITEYGGMEVFEDEFVMDNVDYINQ